MRPADTISDYDLIGGAPAVAGVVHRFYELVLGDSRLSGYFTGVDLPRLRRHQVLLISQVLGGPAEYDGRELAQSHKGLDISREDFGRVVEHLVAAMRAAGVPAEVVDRVVATLAETEQDIVTAPGSGGAVS